jgi:hypothetical protein
MVTSMSHTQGRRARIAREHELIHERLGRISQELDHVHRDPEVSSADWKLPALVRDLRKHMRRHFELEESGGLLGGAAQYYDPELSARVDELIAQHRDFERRLDRLLAELQLALRPAQIVRTCFDRDFAKFVELLRRHERAENELFRQLLG